MDRSSRQKINKETQSLNDTVDQIDLLDIYRTLHLKAAEYTFFSSAHGTFSQIDHILGLYSNSIPPQETRKISNKQPNFTPKAPRESSTNKTQS